MSVCFEVQVNDGRPVVAGRQALDVLTAMVTFVHTHSDIQLRAGGLHRLADGGSEQVEWVLQKVAVGDEIRIRIRESDAWSEPMSVEREAGTDREQSERAYYEQLKRKYEPQQG